MTMLAALTVRLPRTTEIVNQTTGRGTFEAVK